MDFIAILALNCSPETAQLSMKLGLLDRMFELEKEKDRAEGSSTVFC